MNLKNRNAFYNMNESHFRFVSFPRILLASWVYWMMCVLLCMRRLRVQIKRCCRSSECRSTIMSTLTAGTRASSFTITLARYLRWQGISLPTSPHSSAVLLNHFLYLFSQTFLLLFFPVLLNGIKKHWST